MIIEIQEIVDKQFDWVERMRWHNKTQLDIEKYPLPLYYVFAKESGGLSA